MPKNIAVTGANGFLGKNLISKIKELELGEIFEITRNSSLSEVNEGISNCDILFHLAGVNRPESESEFIDGNTDFTKTIAKMAAVSNSCQKVIFSSTQQVHKENAYGASKLAAEKALQSEDISSIKIYRLTNIFGKWSRPFYNTVVSTFCHQIARGEDVQVHESAGDVRLVFVDDVVNSFIEDIKNEENKSEVIECLEFEKVISVSDLAEQIKNFAEIRKTSLVPNFSDKFIGDLYATYLSFLPEDNFAYNLEIKADNRGDLFEVIKSPYFGQMFFSTTKPGITRGNHYHHRKVEKFIVLQGQAEIKFRKLGGDNIISYKVVGGEAKVVDIPVGYTHSITNIGDTNLLVLFYSNEVFNPERPDTYFEEV